MNYECKGMLLHQENLQQTHATFYWLFRNNKNYYLIEPQSVAWANKLKSVHKAVYAVPVACVFNLIIIKNGI